MLDLDAVGESELRKFDEERDAQQRPPRDAPRFAREPHAFPKMREGLVDMAETVLRHREQLERGKECQWAVELAGGSDRMFKRRARVLVLAPREQDHRFGRRATSRIRPSVAS